MNYSKRDVIIGFTIIALIIIGAFLYKRSKSPQINLISTPTPITFQKDIEESFKYDIPDNINSIELKDVSGGNGRGIATDKEVLADIDDPISNNFYQGWLEKEGNFISLGKLKIVKGGWLLEYNKSKLQDASKIIISLESVFDNTVEKKILEGTFN